MSPDPMFYWQYVMSKTERTIPRVVFLNVVPSVEELERLANDNPNVSFLVETESYPGGVDKFLSNVDYRWRDRIEKKDWVKSWTTTDYVIVKPEDKDLWITPALCGVEVCNTVPGEFKVLENVERVTNWDNARKMLT